MSSCMTKLEFPLEPYMLFRLGKLPHICCLFLHWVLSSFVDPYERFVMLLKSRSRTHHSHMHCSYTGGRHKNMPSIQIQPKMFYSYTRGEHKNMLVRFPLKINAQNPCCYLSKDLLQKRGMAMQKLFKKKREKKELRKNGQVFEIFKTMGTQMPA